MQKASLQSDRLVSHLLPVVGQYVKCCFDYWTLEEKQDEKNAKKQRRGGFLFSLISEVRGWHHPSFFVSTTIYTGCQTAKFPSFLSFINVEYVNCRQEGHKRMRMSRVWPQAQRGKSWCLTHPHVEMDVWTRPLVCMWHFRAARKNLLYMWRSGHFVFIKGFCLSCHFLVTLPWNQKRGFLYVDEVRLT